MEELPIIFGYNVNGIGNSSVPLALCRHWNKAGLTSALLAPSKDNGIQYPWLYPAMGSLQKKFVYRFAKPGIPRERAESYGLKKSRRAKYIYLWAGLSQNIFQKAKQQGHTIIVERINCHQATAKKILDNAFAERDLIPDHGITEESINAENRKLSLADAIFCPSPMVRKSLLDAGVEEDKLLDTSYGWSPKRFPERTIEKSTNNNKTVFLFVGTLCLRKGVPLLLEAWKKAKIDGQLIFCGTMDETIKNHFGHYFERPDIIHVPFTNDIGSYYNRADAFVFPTLEEGGPMVTYEAMAHGVLPLVSEMGAGAIAEHKRNGIVLNHSVGAWATAIQAVHDNKPRRQQLAKAAVTRAMEFTWEKVAAGRAALLRQKFPDLWLENQ